MTKQKKIMCAASWVLTALCMAAIFFFSHQNSDASAEISMDFYSKILELIGRVAERLGHDGIRTLAHFTEYTALGFLMSTSQMFTCSRRRPWLTLGLCAAYAVTDEIHQLFVPGRAFQVKDMAVDSAGALLGISVFFLLSLIILNIQKKKTGPIT